MPVDSGAPIRVVVPKLPTNPYFVSKYQDPFGQLLKSIIDPMSHARKTNTLKREDVLRAQSSLEAGWSQFQSDAGQYGALGLQHRATVQGAMDTLTPQIEQFRREFDTDLTSFGTQQTAEETAQAAAVKQRKRARGAVGRKDTILTGGLGLPGLPEENRQVKTLLGY